MLFLFLLLQETDIHPPDGGQNYTRLASIGLLNPLDTLSVYIGSFPGIQAKHTSQMWCEHSLSILYLFQFGNFWKVSVLKGKGNVRILDSLFKVTIILSSFGSIAKFIYRKTLWAYSKSFFFYAYNTKCKVPSINFRTYDQDIIAHTHQGK